MCTGMPVTTVAEQLSDAEYAAFVAFREGLGLQVFSHRDPGALAALIDAIHRRRVVCLLAIATSREPASRCPGGATHHHASRSGDRRPALRSDLLPAVCQFTEDGMLIIIGEPIAPRRPGWLVAMMQEVADFFAETIASQPEDWHMMQPFFSDRTPAEEAR